MNLTKEVKDLYTENYTVLIKENTDEGIILPDLKLYYMPTGIKTLQYWHKDGHMDKGNRIESSEISPCIYNKLIFDKGAKNIQWGRDRIVLCNLNIHV